MMDGCSRSLEFILLTMIVFFSGGNGSWYVGPLVFLLFLDGGQFVMNMANAALETVIRAFMQARLCVDTSVSSPSHLMSSTNSLTHHALQVFRMIGLASSLGNQPRSEGLRHGDAGESDPMVDCFLAVAIMGIAVYGSWRLLTLVGMLQSMDGSHSQLILTHQ